MSEAFRRVIRASRLLEELGHKGDTLAALRDLARLREAATAVANTIHIGAGGMIQGSMMERDLRQALGLKPGELRNVPKQPSDPTNEVQR